ncbi:MAG: ferrochelatase [Coriobacteriia bacterium]|nr:ferrochelatase [Coriobacteriia bacterium]
MPRTGVILLGFGGPDSLDAVGPFMCNLMGREPSDELVERVCRRYLTIGGSSPLGDIAADIAESMQRELKRLGHDAPVRVGMRYWNPFIAEALTELKELGCERVIAVSLSPFESKVASGAYRDAIAQAVEAIGGIEVVEAPLASTLPEYVDYFAGSAAASLTDIEPNDGAVVVFTAHSLPESDLVEGDPYVTGLERVAHAVAEKLGMGAGIHGSGDPVLPGIEAFGSVQAPRAWFLVYQSKGERPGNWLGPWLDEVVTAAADSKATALVVVPIGFMTDHMETLYDLDVIAAEQALDLGLEWARARVPNADDSVVEGLCRLVTKML